MFSQDHSSIPAMILVKTTGSSRTALFTLTMMRLKEVNPPTLSTQLAALAIFPKVSGNDGMVSQILATVLYRNAFK